MRAMPGKRQVSEAELRKHLERLGLRERTIRELLGHLPAWLMDEISADLRSAGLDKLNEDLKETNRQLDRALAETRAEREGAADADA